MSKLAALGLSMLGLLAMVAAVRADGLLGNLNPFSSGSSNNQTLSGTVITSNSKSKTITTVPTMNGIAVHPPATQPSQPSLLSKMGSGVSSGVSSMYTKTKQFFFRPKPAAPVNNGPYKTYPQPLTTSQFIGQPRPQP